MYDVLTGKQRALVFPVMCNADVKIDYSDNVPDSADDVGYGIWSHGGDFTFEAIVTPYDINGALATALGGRTLVQDKKIMPSNHDYLPTSSALSHEMRIFSSTNFYISLKNSTTTNANQPSEYKILVGIKLSSGAVQEFTTNNVVITPTKDRSWVYSADNLNLINSEGRIEFDSIGLLDEGTEPDWDTLTFGSLTSSQVGVGDQMYVLIGGSMVFIGTATAVNTSNNTVTVAVEDDSEITIYTRVFRRAYTDPTYVENSFHIACTYAETPKELNIYLNGLLVKTGTHAQSGTFSFEDEDLFIGANGNREVGVGSTVNNKQFMGEMHEMCLSSVYRRRFPSITSLHPNYNDTLFYFRFEEVDL